MRQPLSSEEVLHTRTLKKNKEKIEKRGKSLINPKLKAQKERQFSHEIKETGHSWKWGLILGRKDIFSSPLQPNRLLDFGPKQTLVK